jgi:hypothetical protein
VDSQTLVPVLGFCGTLVVAAGAALTAVLTNRSETGKAAETALEKTLRERILLRDEQNAELKVDLVDCMDRGRRKDGEIVQLRVRVQELESEIQRLQGDAQKDKP